MAFGLGFNKAKVLSAAEKYVAQGKIPAAIEEYRKLLEHDQKDLTILNTFADLCVRAGKNEEAVKRFYELADKCVEAGLVARAIAVYKRIVKVAPDSVQAFMRLGELYSMQGLLRDSRAHYLQAVEFYSQQNDKGKARDTFEKVLMLDMENPQLQARMGQLYAETGKKEEAIASYMTAVERYLDRNQGAEATATLESLLALDGHNPEVRTLLGRSLLDRGESGKAIEALEAIPSVTSHKAALNLLFHAYAKSGYTDRARETANQIFDIHGDFAGLAVLSEELVSQGHLDEALAIYQAASERLLSQRSSSALLQGLRKILAAEPSHIQALQLLLRAHQATGAVGEARETSELLAHAYVGHGELPKAREIYSELVTIEPDNPDHLRLLRQVEAHMGESPVSPGSSAEPAAAMADFASPAEEETRPSAIPAREEKLVKNCITEAELYITYHQFSKAIEALENGLSQLSGNVSLNEQLLTVCEQAKEYGKAAACCEALAEAYVKAGDGERAARYAEMILNYQQKAQQSASQVLEGPPAEEFSMETSATEDVGAMGGFAAPASAFPGEGQSQAREMDLSMEWTSISGDQQPSTDDSAIEEIEFYIQAGLNSDALVALDRLKEQSPAHPAIPGFEERLGLRGAGAASSAESVVAEPEPATDLMGMPPSAEPADEAAPVPFGGYEEFAPSSGSRPEEFSIPFEIEPQSSVFPEPSPEEASQPIPTMEFPVDAEPAAEQGEELPASFGTGSEPAVSSAPPSGPPSNQLIEPFRAPFPTEPEAQARQEFTLEESFLSVAPTASAADFELSLGEPEARQPAGSSASAAPKPAPAEDPFASLTGDLAQELDFAAQPGKPETPSSPQAQAAAAAKGAPAPAAPGEPAHDPLTDIFAEFKAEMEEPQQVDDVETHFNMGIAFKEMGLYDEAIGEFQKVQQLAGRSKDYSYAVRCCSLLASCFLEKGLPQLAVKWYQTALDTPAVDPETSLALLYEMGSAYETAGDRQAALRSFLEVYARNIDYRDVANRIHSLQHS